MSKAAAALTLAGLLVLVSACGGSHRTTTTTPGAYAYLVPANPGLPNSGQWATRVSEKKIQVGDRVPGPNGRLWKVVAVQPTSRDGQHAAIRGWPPLGAAIRHPNRKWGTPVWAGKLVLRQLR
jgi:hypothetical protein